MRDTKLYKAVQGLNGFELNRLHRFILSPYFNQNQAIVSLFEWIKTDLRSNDPREQTKEDVWSKVYGSVKYSDTRFRKLMSDLLKLIEDFYIQEKFESNKIYKVKFLLDSIYEKKLDPLEASSFKRANEIIASQNPHTASYYYYKFEIEKSLYHISLKENERKVQSNLDQILASLDHFYLIEKLKYYSFVLDHQTFAQYNYKMLFTEEIIEHLKNNTYNNVPTIQIYFQILLTLIEPENKNHYLKLKSLLNEHINLFSASESKEIIDAALNYCIIKMNSGHNEFVQEAFDLYKQSLAQKAIFINDKITPWSFKNIVTIGLRLKEFDWVEEFINTISFHLEERYRENAITFNLAQLYFYKKEYQKVIQQLSKVEYEDFTYNLNSKTLLMASYYELEEFEALNSLLDAFRIYVQRNKNLTKGKGAHYQNTINLVRKMSRIKHGDTTGITKLRKEVNEAKGIVSKNWILEKLDALQPQEAAGSRT